MNLLLILNDDRLGLENDNERESVKEITCDVNNACKNKNTDYDTV